MLRNGMKALQRVAALQWCREACAASGGGITANLPSLAVAMQQLALQQQLSWASNSQPSGCRQFAASAGGGGDGGSDSQQQHAADAAALSEGKDAVQQLASESGQLVFKDYEESLEAWGKAMDEGAAVSSTVDSSERCQPAPAPACLIHTGWCICLSSVAAGL